jgi:hypothetical protein
VALPPYIAKAEIAARLARIFPPGTPHRNYCTRDLAASTVFVMLYIGAVEGGAQFLGPKHVYAMSDQQSEERDEAARVAYASDVLSRNYQPPGRRWYADNTREPIRDETLREGLIPTGAAIARDDIPTTSSKPRYALRTEFAVLFDPSLAKNNLDAAIARWQQANLTPGALARIEIIRRGAVAGRQSIVARFPNGETRLLSPGPSSVITQAVIESFAPAFLERPAVLWVSESGNKVVARDDALARGIGLDIAPDRNLPDIILVDLGPAQPLIVFIEVVATDGAMTVRRQNALFDLTDAAGFDRRQVAFVTAYHDRETGGFKKTVSGLAWGSFAWFVAEPDRIVVLWDRSPAGVRLSNLLRP